MAVTIQGRVLCSQLFGALAVGDLLEYHIYDDGQDFAFKLLHIPHTAFELPIRAEPGERRGAAPTVVESVPDRLCGEAASSYPEVEGSLNAGSVGPTEDDVCSAGTSSSTPRSLAPSEGCNAYVLRGAFRWCPDEFPLILTVEDDDPVRCALSDVEYEHFAVHHLHHRGCPF